MHLPLGALLSPCAVCAGTGKHELPHSLMRHVLVLSAGGYGHVALPLLKGPELRLASGPPVGERKFALSFVGTLGNAPHNLRERMSAAVQQEQQEGRRRGRGDEWFIGKSTKWQAVVASSALSLAPRGYGRTSYRLSEIIQLGRIPVYVYSDSPWIPYPRVYRKFGFATHIANLSHTLRTLRALSTAQIEGYERLAAKYRELWTYQGTMQQVALFLQGKGHLVRTALPRSIRDAR